MSLPSAAMEGKQLLKKFMLRTAVLRLYRSLYRNAAPLGQDGRSHIRQQFESHRSAKDLDQIEHLLADGKRFEKQLRDMRILSGE